MKKQYTLWLLFMCNIYLLKAQVNLVPNPSFEEYVQCPKTNRLIDTLGGIDTTVKYWYNPTSTTPDYYNRCTGLNDIRSVPNNQGGYQEARTQNAYIGLAAYYSIETNYREYFTTKLNETLTKDTLYHIEYFVSLTASRMFTINAYAVSTLGCLFTPEYHYYDTFIYPEIPQLETDSLALLTDTVNWMKISHFYKATGNERFLTLGNFRDDAHTKRKLILLESPIAHSLSYFYIDDVSLIKYATPENTVLDTAMCHNDSIIFSMRKDFDSCVWNDGSKLPKRVFTTTGKYWVTSYYSTWLSYTDTFNISFFNAQSTITSASFCKGQSLSLQSKSAINYLWNTGDTISTINVSNPNIYWVKRSLVNCALTDSFYVTEKPLPIITTLQDTTVCFDEVVQILLDAGHFKSYLWKPTGETTQTIYSTTAQVYILTVTDSNNCSTSKQVAVMETCPDFVYIPNAFTPNNDGINDVFLPKTRSLEEYELSIINRWGAVVFKTKNPQQAWDGKDSQEGVYVVTVNYKVAGKPVKTVTQNVTLLR